MEVLSISLQKEHEVAVGSFFPFFHFRFRGDSQSGLEADVQIAIFQKLQMNIKPTQIRQVIHIKIEVSITE